MDLLDVLGAGMVHPDEREGRIYGLLYGVISDVKDPQSLGRVRARFGAMGDNEQSEWLEPGWPGAIEGIPAVKEHVFVAFVDGDVHRGVYWWHPTTNTKNRATEWLVLGLTFAGMYNDLATKFDNLKTKVNNIVSTYNGHTHIVVGTCPPAGGPLSGGVANATTSTETPDNDSAIGKIQKSDGSSVSASPGDQKALSGRAKVSL